MVSSDPSAPALDNDAHHDSEPIVIRFYAHICRILDQIVRILNFHAPQHHCVSVCHTFGITTLSTIWWLTTSSSLGPARTVHSRVERTDCSCRGLPGPQWAARRLETRMQSGRLGAHGPRVATPLRPRQCSSPTATRATSRSCIQTNEKIHQYFQERQG